MPTSVIATATAMALTGCQFYKPGAAGIPKQTVKHGEPITVRTDQLPGAGELLPDGRVRYVVAVGELCQAPKVIETRLEMQPSITVGGVAYFVASGAMMAAGAGLIGHGVIRQDELGSNKSERTAEISIGVGALIAGALLTALGASRAGKQKRKLAESTSIPTQTRTDGVEEVPCTDVVAALGELELITPWNTKSTGKPDASGSVTFDVVWVGDMLDPDAATAESLIAAPWKVAATNAKISTTWQPLGPQLPQALDIARAAKKKAAGNQE